MLFQRETLQEFLFEIGVVALHGLRLLPTLYQSLLRFVSRVGGLYGNGLISPQLSGSFLTLFTGVFSRGAGQRK